MRYIQIPGTRTHELPPLLVRSARECGAPAIDMEVAIAEAEEMLPSVDADDALLERRKIDLAVSLTEQYHRLVAQWGWGDSIVEWIRQCEITFEAEASLRPLLHPDVWPHASRASFVTLLEEKGVPTPGIDVENAVGLRLTFRQPPPFGCFSNEFLFCLNGTVAGTAYRRWAQMAAGDFALLPPHRFHFEVFALPVV